MKDFEQPKDSEEFKHDQRNPVFRKVMKQWREAGFSRYLSRRVAREIARKPSN